MREAITIIDPESIDLGRHAVIEASAGTGKTYAIENLFIRCLLEKRGAGDRPLKVNEILAVTFTEKATGELKMRIREKIRSLLREGPATERDKGLLRDALENFDTAGIFTIHGFCRNVLRQYAFENGEPFTLRIEDDAALYEKALKEQMRKDWKAWFGPDLAPLLEISGFADRDSWIDETVGLAVKYRPECGERIMPDIPGEPKEYFSGLIGDINKGLDELGRLAGPIDADSLEDSAFNIAYGSLCTQDRRLVPRRRDTILPMLRLLSVHSKKGALDITGFSRFMRSADEKSKKFAYLIDEDMKEAVLRDRLPALPAIVGKLEELRILNMRLSAVLRVSAARKLKCDVAEYKRERGIMSYEDMLRFVDRALSSGGILKEELRKRYACALIDEFQDTDMVQWRILKAVFLTDANELFVIGDPKQAIYGFRGADVDAYLAAKDEMLEGCGANYYSLSTNWRSAPGLIQGFNRLFSEGNWFPGDDIKYTRISAPAPDRRKTRAYHDSTGRAAITAVDLDSRPGSETCHKAMARFMADEVSRLLKDGGRRLVISKDGVSSPITAGDICILIKGRGRAALIERALDGAGVPHSFYKKSGLYRSDEAIQIRYVLAAAEDPSCESAFRKALLTPFFGVSPRDMACYAALPPTHSLKALFQRWYGYAASRRWPLLFQSIIEDTGIYYDKDVTERQLANYRQIFEALETEALSRNLDIVDVVKALDRYREREEFDDEAFDIERLETEEPKVKIMTIHASKGLEFPIVFIADGFAAAPASDPYWKYHDDDHGVVYDLTKSAEAKARLQREGEREARQLFYVALTRSKYKLYIPKFSGDGRSKGPLAYIVNEALGRAWPDGRQDGQMLRFVDLEGRDIDAEPPLIIKPDPLVGDIPARPKARKAVLPDPLFPERSFSFSDRKIDIESYSRLKEKADFRGIEGSLPDRSWISYYDEAGSLRKADDDDIDAGDGPEIKYRPADGKSAAILRAGSDTGSMLHEILEEIDFASVGAYPSFEKMLDDPAASSLIDRKLKRFGFIPSASVSGRERELSYKKEAARIIWNTLNVPLPHAGRPLSAVRPADKLVELEFHYPFPGPKLAGMPGKMRHRDGFLMGYIDLVFRSEGRYFFLDWKSNYIETGYAPSAIKENIEGSGYDLQYKVYSIAVLRWLKALVKGFDYERHFGGIYYIYLRGMDAANPGEGYVHIRPDSESAVREYERELFRLVNRVSIDG